MNKYRLQPECTCKLKITFSNILTRHDALFYSFIKNTLKLILRPLVGLVTYSLKYAVCYFPFPVTIPVILWKKSFFSMLNNSLLFILAQILHTKIKGGCCLS